MLRSFAFFMTIAPQRNKKTPGLIRPWGSVIFSRFLAPHEPYGRRFGRANNSRDSGLSKAIIFILYKTHPGASSSGGTFRRSSYFFPGHGRKSLSYCPVMVYAAMVVKLRLTRPLGWVGEDIDLA